MSAASESKYSTEVLSELLSKLQVADNKDEAASTFPLLNSSIVEHDVPVEFFEDLKNKFNLKMLKFLLLLWMLQTHCFNQRFIPIR